MSSHVEHGVIQSSISLLQERFKQLQKVKETREKKELLRMFSDYNSKDIPFDSYNYEPSASHNTTTNDDANDDDSDIDNDDELQIFLPPNYYYPNYSRKLSRYSSSTSSPSSLSHSNQNYHNLNEISLSLSPPISFNNATTSAVAAAERFRRSSSEAPVSQLKMSRPSSCVSSAYKMEESHVSDVDTTLHL